MIIKEAKIGRLVGVLYWKDLDQPGHQGSMTFFNDTRFAYIKRLSPPQYASHDGTVNNDESEELQCRDREMLDRTTYQFVDKPCDLSASYQL